MKLGGARSRNVKRKKIEGKYVSLKYETTKKEFKKRPKVKLSSTLHKQNQWKKFQKTLSTYCQTVIETMSMKKKDSKQLMTQGTQLLIKERK